MTYKFPLRLFNFTIVLCHDSFQLFPFQPFFLLQQQIHRLILLSNYNCHNFVNDVTTGCPSYPKSIQHSYIPHKSYTLKFANTNLLMISAAAKSCHYKVFASF